MRKRTRIVIIVGIILVLALPALWISAVLLRRHMSEVDFQRALRGEHPKYARLKSLFSDGGTSVYRGLGYELTLRDEIHLTETEIWGTYHGPVLKYQLNGFFGKMEDKQRVWFIPDEEQSEWPTEFHNQTWRRRLRNLNDETD